MYLFNVHSEEAPEHQVKHFLLRGLSLTNALVTDTENHLISANASAVKGARFPPTPKGLPHPQPPFLPVAAIPYSQEIRCSQGSFPETPRVDGCEDFTEGLGHLQNLQRGRSKADLHWSKLVGRVGMRSRRDPPKEAGSHADRTGSLQHGGAKMGSIKFMWCEDCFGST